MAQGIDNSNTNSNGKHIHTPTHIQEDKHKNKKAKLVGAANFVRNNPLTDRFHVKRFHHLEFYCGDATNTAGRFSWGLGMKEIARSDHSTNNHDYCSIVLQSNELVFTFTAPYNSEEKMAPISKMPNPTFTASSANAFIRKHGLAVKAVALEVDDAALAYRQCIAGGGISMMPPTVLFDDITGTQQIISEVSIYGEETTVALRFVSGDFCGPMLCNYKASEGPDFGGYGLQRLDHCVGNVPHLLRVIDYINEMTGFHEFAEFTAEDVGTVDSGLNSMVMANNNEMVLLPINEPTFGTKRKSQIQTYLEQNNGAGIQHLALKTNDIFFTMSELRKRSHVGGFQFMPRPSEEYYAKLPEKMGNSLTPEQLKQIKELGLLADKDDQGVLLQVFTKPVGDRPTLFLEIIQRVGCNIDEKTGMEKPQQAGCGGFGKGNFTELFKSIERYEKTLES